MDQNYILLESNKGNYEKNSIICVIYLFIVPQPWFVSARTKRY